jgi:hypothetical protein
MIENIENEKECCGSCDFCMFDNNGNALCRSCCSDRGCFFLRYSANIQLYSKMHKRKLILLCKCTNLFKVTQNA